MKGESIDGNMSILELDSKGRLTLPKEVRESLDIGKKVLIINAGDHLKIIPLPPDPVQRLHGVFSIKKSFRALRKQAELTGKEEEAKKREELTKNDSARKQCHFRLSKHASNPMPFYSL